MTLEEIAKAIRKIRDECNAFLTELELDQITREQAAKIERDIDKIKDANGLKALLEITPHDDLATPLLKAKLEDMQKPRCTCGRDLLTNELVWGVCYLCRKDDGTLLGEERKYVPGVGV